MRSVHGVTAVVAEAFHFVLDSVAMDEVHDDHDAYLMGFVNESFEFFRRAEAAGGCEERADMISETAVIGMFGNGHDLNAVVAFLDDAGKHIQAEFLVGSHFFCILRHTDVAFIDEEGLLFRTEALDLPFIGLGRIPHLCGEDLGLLVLHDALGPCRYAFSLTSLPVDGQLLEVLVVEFSQREFQFPVSGALDALEGISGIFFPSVEIADEIDFRGIGCPFAQHPLAGRGVKAEVEVTIGEVSEGGLTSCELLNLLDDMVVASLDCAFEGLEPVVVLDELQFCRLRNLGCLCTCGAGLGG